MPQSTLNLHFFSFYALSTEFEESFALKRVHRSHSDSLNEYTYSYRTCAVISIELDVINNIILRLNPVAKI